MPFNREQSFDLKIVWTFLPINKCSLNIIRVKLRDQPPSPNRIQTRLLFPKITLRLTKTKRRTTGQVERNLLVPDCMQTISRNIHIQPNRDDRQIIETVFSQVNMYTSLTWVVAFGWTTPEMPLNKIGGNFHLSQKYR